MSLSPTDPGKSTVPMASNDSKPSEPAQAAATKPSTDPIELMSVPTSTPVTADRKDGHFPPEPEMAYAPPEYHNISNDRPLAAPGVGPRFVTPLAQLGPAPREVDCPYCRKVVMSTVQEVSTSESDMMMCLLCLICWPLMCCYEGDKDINHICSSCRRQLTHQPHGGPVTVVAQPVHGVTPLPNLVVSAFEHDGTTQQPQSARAQA